MGFSFQDAVNAMFLWKRSRPEAEPHNDANPDNGLQVALDALCRLPETRAGPSDQIVQPIAVDKVQRVSDTLHSLHMSQWKQEDTVAWSHRPRTYIILHNLGCVHLMNNFVKDGMTDIWLPYNDVTLPNYVQPPAMRALFLEAQQYLLTGARDLEDLSAGVSSTKVLPHIHLPDGGNQHFKKLSTLGKGSFGYVTRFT